jgi:hypothetical protein
MNDLLQFCQSQLEWTVETIDSLVRLESPTTDKAAVDRCGVELSRRLAAIGGRVQPLPRETAGDHLLAEFGCGESQVLILGHFDTVWPVGQLARTACRIEDGRLYGPGSFGHRRRDRPRDARGARALRNRSCAGVARRDALDDGRGNGERDLARRARGRSSPQQSRAGLGAVASGAR